MKRLSFILWAYLALMVAIGFTANADAQQLAPAAAPPDYTGLIVVFAALALGGGLFVLKRKRPDTFNKITAQAGDVQHTIGGVVDKVKAEAESRLHVFEATHAPDRAPAIAPTPTSQPMQYAATQQQIREALAASTLNAAMTTTYVPPATAPEVAQQQVQEPKFINGRLVG